MTNGVVVPGWEKKAGSTDAGKKVDPAPPKPFLHKPSFHYTGTNTADMATKDGASHTARWDEDKTPNSKQQI